MTKQIKNFNKTQLPIGTQANFHKKVLTLIGTTTATALHVEGLEPQYEAAVETLSSIVNRPTTYVATQSRQETDNRRDRFVTVIHQVINAHKNNPLDEKRAAAATLAALMAPYRSITKHQYAKETEEINGMLAVLEAHATEAGLLGLTDEVAGLTEANAAFEAALDEKIAEEQARQAVSDIDSREATRAANDLYDQVVQVVNAYAIVSPTDEIEGFIDQLNATVAVYAAMIDASPTSPTTPGEPEEPDGGDDTGEPTDPTEPTDPDGGDDSGTPGEI